MLAAEQGTVVACLMSDGARSCVLVACTELRWQGYSGAGGCSEKLYGVILPSQRGLGIRTCIWRCVGEEMGLLLLEEGGE